MDSAKEKIFNMLAEVRAFRRADNYPLAWDQLLLALSLCPTNRQDLCGSIQAMHGQLYRNEKNHKKALDHYSKALDHFRKTPDRLRQAHVLRHLAEIKAEEHLFQAAGADFEECRLIYEAHPEASGMDLANFYRAYALFLEKAGTPTLTTVEFWKKALAIYEAFDIQDGVTECRDHLDVRSSN